MKNLFLLEVSCMVGFLVILLMTSPYTSQNSHTAIELCRAARRKDISVQLHLFMDAPINANRNIDTMKEVVNYAKEIELLIEEGVLVTFCPMCATYRGLREEDFVPGVQKMPLLEFAENVALADAFLTLA
ncbi:MAG: DsrE family protein [Candidatus Hodarchaeota archaeon]